MNKAFVGINEWLKTKLL